MQVSRQHFNGIDLKDAVYLTYPLTDPSQVTLASRAPEGRAVRAQRLWWGGLVLALTGLVLTGAPQRSWWAGQLAGL